MNFCSQSGFNLAVVHIIHRRLERKDTTMGVDWVLFLHFFRV